MHPQEMLDKLSAVMLNPSNQQEKNHDVIVMTSIPLLLRILRNHSLEEGHIETVAKIIASTFPVDTPNGPSSPPDMAMKIIYDIFSNKSITDDKITMLAKFLELEPRVSVPDSELKKLRDHLRNQNLEKRANLMPYLKRKSKALIRWKQTTNIETLEQEAELMKIKEKQDLLRQSANKNARATLYSVILEKRMQEKELNFEAIVRCFQNMNEIDIPKEERTRILPISLASKYADNAFMAAIFVGRYDLAEKLYEYNKKLYHIGSVSMLFYALSFYQSSRGDFKKGQYIIDQVLRDNHITISEELLMKLLNSEVGKRVEDTNFELFLARFKLDTSISRRITNSVRKQELQKLISSNKLEDAFQMVKKVSETQNNPFGHYELMLAAIQQQNNEVLTNIRKLIALKHDLNTSMIDFGVCLLEAGQISQAEKILGGQKIYLSLDKMEFIVSREMKQKRPDVLHKLFGFFNDPRKSSANELMTMVESTVKLYGQMSNYEDLKQLNEDIKKANFPVSHKLKLSIENTLHKKDFDGKFSEWNPFVKPDFY